MNKVQERFWIPQLRHITRRLRLSCNHCKKFRAGALSAPPMAALPSFRAEFTDPFSSTGVDFIGPLYHKTQGINPGKAYVVLFICACTCAIHLRLCTDMTVEQFKQALKEFVARRGASRLIVSDNAKTFIGTKGWLKTLQEDEDLNFCDKLVFKILMWQGWVIFDILQREHLLATHYHHGIAIDLKPWRKCKSIFCQRNWHNLNFVS